MADLALQQEGNLKARWAFIWPGLAWLDSAQLWLWEIVVLLQDLPGERRPAGATEETEPELVQQQHQQLLRAQHQHRHGHSHQWK